MVEQKEPKSKFIRIRCTKCKNEQIVFSKATSEIKCLVCEETLATPTGGKVNITANVLEVLDQMFYKKKEIPKEGEIVLCTVKKISYHSVFLKLDEYNNLEGMMHISEIAPGRIRTIRDYVKEGKKVVCKILRVNKITKSIELSLRRVNKMQRINKSAECKQEQKAEKLLEFVGKELKKDIEYMYKEAGYELISKYGSLNESFQNLVLDKDQINELEIKKEISDLLIKTVIERIKPKEVQVKGVLNISLNTEDGVDTIKKVLTDSQKGTIKIIYMGAPKYQITVTASDYKTAEEILENVTGTILKKIKDAKGTGEFIQEKN